jgi:putative colanic acid biosysnthesis UDP-glucose lipid carrier transferase
LFWRFVLLEPVTYLPVLNTAVRHTAIPETGTTHKKADLYPNVNAYPFVARRNNYLFLKRMFDIVFSVMVLALLFWLFALVALWIIIDSKGPVFFRQKRVGRNGKIFWCIKFRTMYRNEEADEKPACKNDTRITRAGRILRNTCIDELPQFFNVLAGQMSIVGPRPHMVTDCIRFSFIISTYSFRNLVPPGITGWAQVKGYHGRILDYESIQQRYHWDAMYVNKASFRLDLRIVVKTIWMIGEKLIKAGVNRVRRLI